MKVLFFLLAMIGSASAQETIPYYKTPEEVALWVRKQELVKEIAKVEKAHSDAVFQKNRPDESVFMEFYKKESELEKENLQNTATRIGDIVDRKDPPIGKGENEAKNSDGSEYMWFEVGRVVDARTVLVKWGHVSVSQDISNTTYVFTKKDQNGKIAAILGLPGTLKPGDKGVRKLWEVSPRFVWNGETVTKFSAIQPPPKNEKGLTPTHGDPPIGNPVLK